MNNPYSSFISEPKKLKKAEKNFVTALKKCLEKDYDFNKVTISSLCKLAKYSRPTFYAYYDTVIDVLKQLENELMWDIYKHTPNLDKINLKSDEFKKELDAFMDYLESIKDRLKPILIDKIDQRFMFKWRNYIKYNFYDKYKHLSNYDFYLEVIASAITNGIRYFLKNSNPKSREEYLKSVMDMYKLVLTKY